MEDVRVRRYVAIRDTRCLVHAVVYLAGVWIGAKQRLNILVKRSCEKERRFSEVASFSPLRQGRWDPEGAVWVFLTEAF